MNENISREQGDINQSSERNAYYNSLDDNTKFWIEEDAKQEADRRAKRILSTAMSRYASEVATERTVASIPLQGDDERPSPVRPHVTAGGVQEDGAPEIVGGLFVVLMADGHDFSIITFCTNL